MKKVLFCIRAVTGNGGGAEKVFSQTVTELHKKGYAVKVIAFDNEAPSFYSFENVPIVFLGVCSPNKSISPLGLVQLIWKLRSCMAREKPDVAVGFMNSAFVPLLIACFGKGVKVVGSEHAPTELYDSKPIQRFLNRWVSRLLWRKTVTSDFELRKQHATCIEHTVVMENPLDIGFTRLGKSPPAYRQHLNILAVGTLRQEKRFDVLISAFGLVAESIPGWTLSIVGDGPLMPELSKLVQESGLKDRVLLLGASKNVLPFYKTADFLVVSSEYESFGLVAVEALASSLPVLAFTRCSGLLRFVKHEENGLLVEVVDNEVTDLAKALRSLISKPEVLNNLKQGAENFDSSEFGMERFVQKWTTLLDAV